MAFAALAWLLAIAVPAGGTAWAGAPAAAPAPRRVLLTAFEPFGGSPINNSEDVARKAAGLLRGFRAGIEARVCVLPVVYDGGAALAKRCFESMNPKPDLVVSLGEGDCTFRLETRAHNRDHAPGFADNAGVIRENRVILAGWGEQVGFGLPVDAMVCAIPEALRSRVSVSLSPGNYVCNNVAFHLARYLEPRRVPFGFIHVPHSRCPKDARDAEVNAGMLASAVLAALDRGAGGPRLPVSGEEAETLLTAARGAPHSKESACRIEFYSRLRQRYF